MLDLHVHVCPSRHQPGYPPYFLLFLPACLSRFLLISDHKLSYHNLNATSNHNQMLSQVVAASCTFPQVCVRFSFNFRHWLILFHQPIAISQGLGL